MEIIVNGKKNVLNFNSTINPNENESVIKQLIFALHDKISYDNVAKIPEIDSDMFKWCKETLSIVKRNEEIMDGLTSKLKYLVTSKLKCTFNKSTNEELKFFLKQRELNKLLNTRISELLVINKEEKTS